MSQFDINQAVSLLLSLARDLQALDDKLLPLERDYVTKAEVHNVAYNKAFLKAKGEPQYMRKALAEVAVEHLSLPMALAEVDVRATKRKMDIMRTRIGVGRTVVASLRAELELEKRIPNR